MIKKIPFKKILPIICLAVVAWVGMGGVAHAWNPLGELFSLSNILFTPVLAAMAFLAYIIFSVSAVFLGLCGMLMNVAMQLTVHLDIFVNSNPIIFTVWETIRDLSSMVLIFFILWAAIQMILDLKPPGFGSLLKSIIIAGILINFSFFFSQVMIDASNIVSLQFYNAIAPTGDAKYVQGDKLGTFIMKTATNGSGGISGIFASALKVNQWWSDTGTFEKAVQSAGNNSATLVGIIISNYAGALVMILAGLSFLAAAIATLWRSVVLLLLLGFSPIWIAGYAVPGLKEFREQWWTPFKTNLLFLPTYMALMYVAVLIINKSDLNNLISKVSVTQGSSTETMAQLFIAFAIIIILINIPLLAALKMSGLKLGAVESLSGSMKKFQNWATVGRVGWAGQKLVGQGAYMASKSDTMRGIAQWSPTAGMITSKALSKVSSATFGGSKGGYDARLKGERKNIEDMHKQIGEVERGNFAAGPEGDIAFKAAEKKAREYQAGFRTSLTSPNLSLLSETNVLNKLLATRSNKYSAAKLNREALGDQIKENTIARDELEKKMKAIARDEDWLKTCTPEEQKQYAELKKERDNLNEKIEEGKKVSGNKKWKKFVEEVSREGKGDEEGGGGGKKKPAGDKSKPPEPEEPETT